MGISFNPPGLIELPTFVEEGIAPRHLDLRPFVLSGRDVEMVPGGFDRGWPLTKGSLVVNSSQEAGPRTPGSWKADEEN